MNSETIINISIGITAIVSVSALIYGIVSKIIQIKKRADITPSDWKIHIENDREYKKMIEGEIDELKEYTDKHKVDIEKTIVRLETSFDFIKESLIEIKDKLRIPR